MGKLESRVAKIESIMAATATARPMKFVILWPDEDPTEEQAEQIATARKDGRDVIIYEVV